tara:strand:+ start:166 stop:825 length:660 start_codon:yes stop_codon:yes gene_type:complete
MEKNSNLVMFLADIINALEHHRYSLSVYSNYIAIAAMYEESSDVLELIENELFILAAIDKPLNSEIVAKIYGLLYGGDSDHLFSPKFKLNTNHTVKKSAQELKTIFPKDLMHSIRNRFVSHLDFDHEKASSKAKKLTTTEIDNRFSEIFSIDNVEKIISLLENIYKEISTSEEINQLKKGRSGIKKYWMRYAKGASILSGLEIDESFIALDITEQKSSI